MDIQTTKMDIELLAKKRDSAHICPASLLLCAEHGTNLAGASPVTGIYRQV